MTTSDDPTEDRRIPSNQDVIDSLGSQLEDHVNEYHAFKADELVPMVAEHKTLVSNAADNKKTLKENKDTLDRVEGYVVDVIETVHGEPETDIDGIIHRKGGLVQRVDALEEAPSGNFSVGDRVVLYAAAMSGLAAITAAVFSAVL